MSTWIITGASRGIGRALALELARTATSELVLTARDEVALERTATEVRRRGATANVVPGDLGSVAGARRLGAQLAERVGAGTSLIHNAGLWPSGRRLNDEGLEAAFVVNHLGPLAMQQRLLDAGRLARVLVISAGLLVKGRFDADRTPSGDDFSWLRTYCTTKLCFAIASRAIAANHQHLDVTVGHPGVVRTALGDRGGILGWMLGLAKRRWEDPAVCAARVARLALEPRWSAPGQATWFFERDRTEWPTVATDPAVTEPILEVTQRLLGELP